MAVRLDALRHCRARSVVQAKNLVAAKVRLSSPLHPWLVPHSLVGRAHLGKALCSALILNVKVQGSEDFDDQLGGVPERSRSNCEPGKEVPLVKVRLSVHYRVHSRQMLCIGGSQIPFGWSFLSIAKVPMTWNQGDVWTCEVELPASQRIEYKYVILEEQDWTKIENEDSEGVVEYKITYRTGSEPGRPPDIQTIQKQMAIVAWQPGPNRILQVPSETELHQLKPGQVVERVPAKPARLVYESQHKALYNFPPNPDPYLGTYETLSLTDEGQVLLDRRDIWLWTPTGVYNGTTS